ncbi:hypothetical protein, partial [Thiohalocapsa halophila]|uniref:hypothetical protein n=1 Tax=Thiohalocapsa halophila TaxID=69359 RepID=UPI001A9336F8
TVKTASAATHQPPRDAAQRLGDIRHHRADATGCAGGRSCFRAALPLLRWTCGTHSTIVACLVES